MKNIGSIKAENNDEVDKQITDTEIEETLIDLKKKIQCNVTILPTPKSSKNCFLSILNNSFLYIRNIIKDTHAINILYQTKCNSSKVINFPNTPVNPKTITIK